MLRFRMFLPVLAFVAALALGLAASAGAATTITVDPATGATDTTDPTPNDGVCDSPCSLRRAVQTADGGSNGEFIIAIPSGSYKLSIPAVLPDNSDPSNGDLDITKDTTIAGGGQGTTTIDGNSVDRIFDIAAGTTATISGLTIEGGVANDGFMGTTGGGIRDFGTLTLNDSTLTGNSAHFGAGLATDGPTFPPPNTPSATLNRVSVLNNTTSGTNGEGGGLDERVGGTLSVNSSLLQGNSASGGGGGVTDDGGGTIAITDTTVDTNHAGTAEAGGVYETGGGTVTLTRTTVSNNTSGEGGGVAEDGGGRITMVDTTISGNVVSGGSFPDAGGILNDAGGSVAIEDTTISDNSAARSGGGIQDIGGGSNDFDIVNTTISGNHASLRGGAVQQGSGTIKLLNATLHDNTADVGATRSTSASRAIPPAAVGTVRTVTVQNSIVASRARQLPGADGLVGQQHRRRGHVWIPVPRATR